MSQPTNNRTPDPSPSEIAERAAEIRQGWTEGVRRQRFIGRGEVPVPPLMPIDVPCKSIEHFGDWS